MFKSQFPPETQPVTIDFEGTLLQVNEGMTVAAAVLRHGTENSRTTPVHQHQRGPFCHMGVCYECLMNIDDQPNQQACRILVREGMKVRRQQGAPNFGRKPEAQNTDPNPKEHA